MNKEYLTAKADLCHNQAVKDLQELNIGKAIKNLERANLALYRIGLLVEEEGEDLTYVSTCKVCLEDFNQADMKWESGYVCAPCGGRGL